MPLQPKADESAQAEESAQMERVKKLEEQIALVLRESVFAAEEGDTRKVDYLIHKNKI